MASAGIAMNSMNLNCSKIHCNRKFMVKLLLLSGTHEMTDDPLWGRLLRAKNHHFRRGMCVTGITVYVLGAQCLISTVKLWNFKKKSKIIFFKFKKKNMKTSPLTAIAQLNWISLNLNFLCWNVHWIGVKTSAARCFIFLKKNSPPLPVTSRHLYNPSAGRPVSHMIDWLLLAGGG